jgi:hypothetical protein
VSVLVLISILLGILLYLIPGKGKFRTDDSFIGGEKINEKTGYPVSGFYHTIREFRLFSRMYQKAEEHRFDLYDLSKGFTLWFSNLMSNAHSGVLSFYTIWILAGLIIMMLIIT